MATIPADALAGHHVGRGEEDVPGRAFAPHQFGAGSSEIAGLHCKSMESFVVINDWLCY